MATIARTSQDEAARLRKRYRNAERLRLTLVYTVLSVIALIPNFTSETPVEKEGGE